jgi:GxxExxY protein
MMKKGFVSKARRVEGGLVDEGLTEKVIGAAIEVHRELGPGLLESAYEMCMARELSLREIPFEMEVPVPVIYKNCKLDCGYRIDIWVDRKVIVEIKSVEKLLPVHEAQLMTYLKLSGCKVGLLLNFNATILTDGLIRRVY